MHTRFFYWLYGLVGLYKMSPNDMEIAVSAALATGYRLFDTATIYRNEEALGRVLAQQLAHPSHSLTRSSLFITSKLQTADQGYEEAKAAIEQSRQRLGVDYIDLYLVHWPGASGLDPEDPRNAEKRRGSWRALEEAREKGLIRAIGVSNYEVRHLKEMQEYAQILPAVNQIEIHPLYYPSDVINCCNELGIHVQAYSSLGRGRLLEETFLQSHSPILEMVNTLGVSLSQIYLRWALQHGFSILPKSTRPDRIQLNSNLYHFSLNPDQMAYLDSIHHPGNEKICWNPANVA